MSGVASGSFSTPEIVEKSSPCRSGVRPYSSSRHASVAFSEPRSSVVAMEKIVGTGFTLCANPTIEG